MHHLFKFQSSISHALFDAHYMRFQHRFVHGGESLRHASSRWTPSIFHVSDFKSHHQVRKAAVQLLAMLLQNNPFLGDLSAANFKVELQKLEKEFQV
jgi:hypothetical protein